MGLLVNECQGIGSSVDHSVVHVGLLKVLTEGVDSCEQA